MTIDPIPLNPLKTAVPPQKRYPKIDEAVKKALHDARYQQWLKEQEAKKEHVHSESCSHDHE